jgi:hypothetical protein
MALGFGKHNGLAIPAHDIPAPRVAVAVGLRNAKQQVQNR